MSRSRSGATTRQARILSKLAAWASAADADKLGSVVLWAWEPERVVVRPAAVLDRLEAAAAGRTYVAIGANKKRTVSVEGPDSMRVAGDRPWFWRLGSTIIQEPGVPRDARGRPHWRFGDVVGPAKFCPCGAVNKVVKRHVHPKVLPFMQETRGGGGSTSSPICLLSVIYLQLQLVLA